MLHGAAALLAVRKPLLLAWMMITAYPWLPDVVVASQVRSNHMDIVSFDPLQG